MTEASTRRVCGHVTIFISMVMMCIFALFCVLVESARTAGARWYLETAAGSVMDSVFSQYHRQLWDTYRLLFAEYEDEEELEKDFEKYFLPYLEAAGWYPMELQSAQVDMWHTVTDDNGIYLEQEILDYMKYGVWKMDFDVTTVDQLWDQAREAEAVQAVGTRYRTHGKEALKLEKALEAITDSQQKQLEKKQEGLRRLSNYDGPGFRHVAGELVRELRRMPGLVAAYEKQADRLAASLKESRRFFEEQQTECTDTVQTMLDEEIRQYEAYVDEDGKRRQEVQALAPESERQIALVEGTIEEAREVEEIIAEWEDDEDDEDGGDGPDLEALWSPVRRHFGSLEVHHLSFFHGVKDKKKEGWLNQVEQLYRSGMLQLVVPEGMQVSTGFLDHPELPSKSEIMTPQARKIPLPDHLMVDEYCGRYFRCFRTNAEGEERSSIGVEGKGGLAYELEYLIQGGDTDEENLSATVSRLLAIREGLNLLHILSDSSKRAQARSLAMAITGVAGFSPLLLLTTFLVMSVWALGESLMDVRGLLAGRKVMLLKGAQDWTLDLDGLLEMGRQGVVETGGGDRGFPYLTWLKLLLLRDEIITQEYRMMDMIQMNICRKQACFRMRRGMYEARINGRFCGKHVFFSLGFVENLTGGQDHTYPMEVAAERVY